MNNLLKLAELAKRLLPGLTQHTPRYLTALLLTIVFMQVITVRADTSLPTIPNPRIMVNGHSGNSISFFESNGRESKSQSLPHLVLLRNGKQTDPGDRTLTIEVSGVNLPPSGGAVSVEVSTQHSIQASEDDSQKRILVWQETRWISSSSSNSRPDDTITFRHEFQEYLDLKGNTFLTPTDYFQINIRITGKNYPTSRPLYHFNQEYAFLMENQWLEDLPKVLEHSPGSAPKELVVYYCDMFPFPILGSDLQTRLPREKINHYLKTDLIPAMLAAYHSESEGWGFPWYEEWRNYRADEPSKRLSVALTSNGLWYHGKSPDIGHARISINLQSNENDSYNSLTESVMSNFYHELFHNLQRNINLHMGSSGDVDGIDHAWQFFSEGTAVLASSVGQPNVQFSGTPGLRSYLINANGYLAGGGHIERDIYKSLMEINPYHATIYWRFLYEQCGGMTLGTENPAVGMQIIRNMLEVLYSSEIVDIHTSSNMVEYLPELINEAIRRTPNCPFVNYEESLNQFAKAIYSLKLENGRCLKPGYPEGCGLFDPEERYLNLLIPHSEYNPELFGEKVGLIHSGDIPNLGIKFLEIELHPSIDGKGINLELINEDGLEPSLHLQIIMLKDQPDRGHPRLSNNATRPAVISLTEGNGIMNFSVPQIDIHECDRLGLIITRFDKKESSNEIEGYTLRVY